jgi:hypothetical protein
MGNKLPPTAFFAGTLVQDSHLQLRVQFQVNDRTPVIRFRYILEADQTRTLSGANSLIYLQTSLKQLPQAEEVTLSNFGSTLARYKQVRDDITKNILNKLALMGVAPRPHFLNPRKSGFG